MPAQSGRSRAPARSPPTRLEEFRAQPRKPGEASFFWYETQLQSVAVKVLPGEYFVHREDILIMTTLGSCIAACLWDRKAGVGGLNHFMLPEGDGDSGRYGLHAMELLIDEMQKYGATRSALEAKVFGGAQVIAGMDTMNVGERNTAFVLDYLRTERIPVVSKDVLDVYPRKVCFMPASGRAMVRRLGASQGATLLARERAAALEAAPARASGGAIDIF